jgi:hypothetical protein
VYIWCLAVLLALFAAPAQAGFVISIGSPTIPQGGTGTLDMFLTGNASPSSPDLPNNYAFTLQITGPNELQFSPSQSFDYLTSSQYVFAGDSTNQMTSSPGGTVATTVYGNDTFVGFDSTFSGNPVSLSSASTPVLLAALTLDATITSPGDSYYSQPHTSQRQWFDDWQPNVFRRVQFRYGRRDFGCPVHQHAWDSNDLGCHRPRTGFDRLRPDRVADPGRRSRSVPYPPLKALSDESRRPWRLWPQPPHYRVVG